MNKQMLTYDKDVDALYYVDSDTWSFSKYMRNLLHCEERFTHFDSNDFKNASVLDIGCSHGGMLTEAKKAGAARTVGVEINSTAASDAVNAGHTIHVVDGEDIWFWRKFASEFDVVLFLAVWNTSRMSDRFAFLSRALSVCTKVFYWDGHTGESANERLKHLLLYSRFTNFKLMGETRNERANSPRTLIRASYDEPSKNSIEFTHDTILTEWKEVHLAS